MHFALSRSLSGRVHPMLTTHDADHLKVRLSGVGGYTRILLVWRGRPMTAERTLARGIFKQKRLYSKKIGEIPILLPL